MLDPIYKQNFRHLQFQRLEILNTQQLVQKQKEYARQLMHIQQKLLPEVFFLFSETGTFLRGIVTISQSVPLKNGPLSQRGTAHY